ncbi:MAG: GIY-YIG nuclease family protein [Candidatus Omnitrophota bacterium]|jgi:putative endonuclease
MNEKPWSVYIIKCRDGKLYTGISNDVDRRVKEHDTGKGCRFTKYRYPVKLVYREECGDQSAARKRELEVQGFTRKKKLELIKNISNVLFEAV